MLAGYITFYFFAKIYLYGIQPNYCTYSYKHTVNQLCSLPITAIVLFVYFFRKAYVVGIHLNCVNAIQMSTHNICLYKENQKKK